MIFISVQKIRCTQYWKSNMLLVSNLFWPKYFRFFIYIFRNQFKPHFFSFFKKSQSWLEKLLKLIKDNPLVQQRPKADNVPPLRDCCCDGKHWRHWPHFKALCSQWNLCDPACVYKCVCAVWEVVTGCWKHLSLGTCSVSLNALW